MPQVTPLLLCLLLVVGAPASIFSAHLGKDNKPRSQLNVEAGSLKERIVSSWHWKEPAARDVDVDFDQVQVDDALTTLLDMFDPDSTGSHKRHITRSNVHRAVDLLRSNNEKVLKSMNTSLKYWKKNLKEFDIEQIFYFINELGNNPPEEIAEFLKKVIDAMLNGKPESPMTDIPATTNHSATSFESEDPCPDGLTRMCGFCLPASYLCDGWEICLDGSDERGCDPLVTDSPTTTKRPATSSGPQTTNTDCGMLPLKNALPKRIVGGNKTKPHEWPSICSLQYKDKHECGGTLVKNSAGRFFVITAAHCYFSPEDLRVVCGIHNVVTGDKPDHSKTFKVKKFTSHENYDLRQKDSDIAVIELDDQPTEEEDQYMQAACLPTTPHNEGEKAVVAGWGALSLKGEYPEVLHEVYKPIDSDEYCEQTYIGINTQRDNNFCAGHRGGGKDACYGDSGGPLYTKRNGRWTLTGVVSFGNKCALEKYIGVYADVYRLRGWIEAIINN